MAATIKMGLGTTATLVLSVFWLWDNRPAMTAGTCSLPAESLSEIWALGVCSDYLPEQYCGAEVPECNSSCDGPTYNPFDDCQNDCYDCMDDCDDTCHNACHIACGDDETCYTACVTGCRTGCYNSCPCNCDGIPDEDRKDCLSEHNETRVYTAGSSFIPVVDDRESSNYTFIPRVTQHCFEITPCGWFCRKALMANWWYCVPGGTSNSPPNDVKHPEEQPTEGECQPINPI